MTHVISVAERTRHQAEDIARLYAPFARYQATRRFQSLDGWRAVAIIAVIFHHTMAGAFTSPIATEGRHGVTLFFIISGFLIVTLLLRSQESPAGFSLWRFWGRRTLRIWPIYFAVLALYCVLVRLTDHSESADTFFRNLPYFASFTSNYFVDIHERTIFFFSWSLAAEEQFYLIWPLIEILIRRPLPKFILLGLLMIASQIAITHQQLTDSGVLLQIPYHIPLGIMLGTAIAHLLHQPVTYRLIHMVLGRPGSASACVGLAVVVACTSPWMGFAGELAIALALALLVTCTVIREDNDLAAVLRWPPIAWVGTVSYGMYMMHMLAVNVVRRGTATLGYETPALVFVGSVCVACAAASASFVCYERPFLKLKDRVFRG